MSICSVKSIDEFCSKFRSIEMNLSGGSSAPTIEVSMVGSLTPTEYDALDKKQLVSAIIGSLISVGAVGSNFHYFWDVTRISSSESEAGVITEVTLVDSVWRKANFLHIGLKDREFGDIELGKEYYDVRAIFFQTIEKDDLTNFLIEKSIYEQEFNDLNFGRKYLNSSGQFLNVPSTVDPGDWIDNIAESLPDPRIEFGEVYYEFKDLLAELKNYSEYFFGQSATSTDPKQQIVSFEGMTRTDPDDPSKTIADVPVGLMNDTGTLFEVMNKAASRHGAIFIANGFVGLKMLKINNNFGKASELKANDGSVLGVPSEAVSSRFIKDYSSGFSVAGALTVLSPGRYPTQKEEDLESNNALTQKSQWHFSSANNATSFVNFNPFLGSDWFLSTGALAWSLIRDLPVVTELGMAEYISTNGTRADLDLQELLDKAYPNVRQVTTGGDWVWYTDFGVPNADFQAFGATAAGFGLANAVTSDPAAAAALSSWFSNYRRFAWTDTIARGDLPISLNGDLSIYDPASGRTYYVPPYVGKPYRKTIGYNQFGTVNYPAGTPKWDNSAAASMGFIDFDTPVTSSSFNSALPFGGATTIDEVLYLYRRWDGSYHVDDTPDYGEGAILIDFGENTQPSFQYNISYSAGEGFLDSTQSLTDKGGSLLNGIAAINKNYLIDIVSFYYKETKQVLDTIIRSVRMRQPPTVSCQGFFDPKPSRIGTSSTSNISEGEKTVVNNKVKVLKSSSYFQFGETVSGNSTDITGSNRKIHAFNANYAFSNVVKWKPAANSSKGMFYSVPYKYLPEQGIIEEGAYYSSAEAPNVEFLEKISFTNKNKPFEIKPGLEKYLENLSISIMDGRATFAYRFSHQPLTPDYRGIIDAKISLQNLIN